MDGPALTLPLVSRALVGREPQLSSLRDAWRGAGALEVVRGAPGIGKSRLVRELTSWARAQGGTVLVGRCSSTSRDTPLRPLREALLSAARHGVRPDARLAPFVPALARVVPEWGDADAGGPGSELVLGEGVLRLLASLASEAAATMLVVEDVQWADQETLAVVEYLADNVAGSRVLVVATIRDDETGPAAELVASLVGRRVATDVALGPLSTDEVLGVARSCLRDEELPPDVAATLVARSEGVPFLVEELLAAAVPSGWDTIAAAVPGSVGASVELRVSALPVQARQLLRAAAVFGRQFDWTVVARAAGVSDDEAADLLRLAARAQLVDVEGAGFRFHHALTRDAILASTGPVDRPLVATKVLAALDDLDPSLAGEHCQIAAALAEQSGQPLRAVSLLLEAARRALVEGSLASADALATRARAGADAAALDDIDDVLLQVCTLAGQTERAAALGLRLLASRTDPDAQADLHVVLGHNALAAGRWDDADSHAAAVRSLAPSDVAVLARASAVAALAAMGRDDVAAALAAASDALIGARDTDQPEVQCEALEVIGRAERGRDVGAAEAAFSEAHDVAAGAELTLWRVRALQELGTIDMFGTLATERLEQARRTANGMGALAIAAVVDLQLAAVYNERGELGLALAAAKRCEDASRRWGLATLPMSLTIQAMAHARAGRRAEMEAAAEAAMATDEDRENVELGLWGNAVAVLHLVTGDLRASALAFDRGMDVLRRRPAAAVPFPGLWALVRTLLDDGGDRARSEVAALPFDTPVSREMLVAAEAVALGRSGAAADANARFAVADEALARHQGFRQGFVRMLVAPAAFADGWGEPVAWLRESLAVFEDKDLVALTLRCRAALRDAGAPVPRRGRGDVEVVPPALAALGITSREADVLALVAAGHTNREVAERLVISPRTVDKHVERLLMKAGTSRAGLAGVARDAGLTSLGT